ncbi:MAG TPA: prevent-host-death protein [Thermoanaerobaculia bacterium]|nr:prevent-host-death protein [Thermoanaerobaculia bacterium]
MRETTFTELRNYAKALFDRRARPASSWCSGPTAASVEGGETIRVYRNGRPVADIVPVKAAIPAWKKAPQTRLSG